MKSRLAASEMRATLKPSVPHNSWAHGNRPMTKCRCSSRACLGIQPSAAALLRPPWRRGRGHIARGPYLLGSFSPCKRGSSMRYKLLGHSGLRVSELCLGTMTFGEDLGWGAPKDESRRMYDAFREAGGNFIDTANIYTNGTSETFLGDFIGADRERVVLATKYGFATKPTNTDQPVDVNNAGNQRKNMLQSVEASLKRLKTDYLDLYWMHGWDGLTPVEEVLRAFDDLVRQGKGLYIGISDTPAWIVSQANTLAKLSGGTPCIAMEIEYNLIERTPQRDMLPMARAFELGVTVWSPLGSGVLTGKYNQSGSTSSRAERTRRDVTSFVSVNDQTLAIAEAVQQVVDEMRAT